MAKITVTKKDGTVTRYQSHNGYTTASIKYEGAFAIVQDSYGTITAYPAADLASVVLEQEGIVPRLDRDPTQINPNHFWR